MLDDPTIIGSGRENLDSANDAAVGLSPVSVSFGGVPAGSGQTRTFAVELSSLDGVAGGYGASVAKTGGGAGVSFAATVSGSTVTVTMTAAKGAAGGEHYGVLTITRGGAEVAHAAVYALVK